MLTTALSPTDRVSALPCGDRMKKALALVADGVPYRDAAREVGYRDHREVYRWAKRAGLLDVHSEQLVAAYKRITALSNAELERRLVEHPEDIQTRDLAIIGGIAADKAAKYENWGRGTEPDAGERIADILAVLHSVTESRTLRLEVSPLPPDARAIDVTLAGESLTACGRSGPG